MQQMTFSAIKCAQENITVTIYCLTLGLVCCQSDKVLL